VTTARYTDGGYLESNPDWHASGSPWKARRIAEILSRNGIRPRTLAEVGCGAGGVLGSLQTRLETSVLLDGYDISPQAIALCLPKANDRLRFFEADFLRSTKRYDVVLAIDVFEHVEDYFGFLRALARRASWHVFHVPLELSCYTLHHHRSLLETRRRVGHLHFYWKDLALASITDCGYKIVDCLYTSPPGEPQPDLPEEPVRSREYAIVRRIAKLVYRVDPDRAVRWFGGTSMMVLAQPADAMSTSSPANAE
jgi:hypothetical protein